MGIHLVTMKRFARALARIRKESGFATPYAFYHKNGGRHAFPFTFAYYLKIERGEALPRPEWLPVLLSLLRIPPTEALHRQFVIDFLKDLMGKDETYEALVAPLLRAAPRTQPERQVTKRLLSEQAYHVTPKQFKAVISNAATYWSFECLVNDRAGLSAAQISATTGFAAAAVTRGLKTLVKQKLARRLAKGRCRSPLAEKFYVFPRAYSGFAKDRDKIWKYEDEMTKKRGGEIFSGGILLRAEEGAIRSVMGGFTDAMETASAFSVNEKGEGTGLFLLQTHVRRMMSF